MARDPHPKHDLYEHDRIHAQFQNYGLPQLYFSSNTAALRWNVGLSGGLQLFGLCEHEELDGGFAQLLVLAAQDQRWWNQFYYSGRKPLGRRFGDGAPRQDGPLQS